MKARRVTSRTRPGPATAPSAAQHNRVLEAAERRALDLEDRLTEILTPLLEQAGEIAASNFEARAHRHPGAARIRQAFPLLASAPNASSTMIAVKPTPAQAEALAEPGGDPPEDLHVTLAYLGETEGDLSEVGDALAGVPGMHAPLEGVVGGVGSFADSGSGHPAILLPSVPGLIELRHHVTQALAAAGIDYSRGYGFVPHMTLAYRQGGPQPPSIDRAGAPLDFGDLWVVRGDRETIQLPLTGVAPVTASADPDLLQAIAEVARRYEPDPPDYGSAWWSDAEATVYWACADWTTNDEIDAAVEAWLEIPEVEQVEVCGECPAPKGGDWVVAYARGSATESLEAASPPLHPPYCLPSDLRTKTDPVRTAVAQTVMQAGVEGAGISFDITNPLAGKVLAQSGSQIVGIAKTTQLDVMKTIRYAHEQGLSIPDTAKAIRAAMTDTAPWRARLIARTELAAAVNGASLAATQIVAAASQGDPGFGGYTKVWMTAPGARYPRHEDYEGLDGQEAALDQPFDVGGYDLMFPGDPDGPPGEVCNCRCAIRYSDGAAGRGDVQAGGHLECLHLAEAPVEAIVDALVAAGAGPADWVAPAPEEVLATECEAPRLPGASLPAPAPEPTPRILGDTISVDAGEPLPADMIAQIKRLGLDQWPPPKGGASFRILGPAKDTEELYYDKAADEWADSRGPIHQTIIDEHFAGKTPLPAGAERHAFFTAGGGASGKSRIRFELDGQELGTDALGERPDTILIDPDRIKKMLPEFGEIVDGGDAYAASAVHEESSWLAKEITREAQERGYNVVLDTTGSSGKFLAKIEQFKAEGYDTQVSMVSVPTNTAIKRAMIRGDKSGRYLAVQTLKDAHRGASEQLPKWMASKAVDRWSLYDNSGPKAIVVARGGEGATLEVGDPEALDAILGKADETTAAPTALPSPGDAASSGSAPLGDIVANLDEAIAAAPTTPGDLVVYRGTVPGEVPAALGKGGILAYDSFVSTTTERAIAQDFAGGHPVLEIHVPAGTAALWLPTAEVGARAGVERELTLPRGTRLIVTGVDHNAEGTVIHATVRRDGLPFPTEVGSGLTGADAEAALDAAYQGAAFTPQQLDAIRYWSSIDGHENVYAYVSGARGDPLPSIDALPLDADAYVAGIQAETRRLGKQVADARFRLKTETDAARRETLEARMAAWQKRRDELVDLAATPDPNAELRRLTKQIANARFEIRNGRGSVRLEARLKALELRREQVRALLGSGLKDEIAAEEKSLEAERAVARHATPARAAAEDGPVRPGAYVIDDPRATDSSYWLRSQIPGPGPSNYVRIAANTYGPGSSAGYEMGESIAFTDANGSGVVIRVELPPGHSPLDAASIAQVQFSRAAEDIPDYMQGRLEQVVVALGKNPDDGYWRTVYKNFSQSAATAGNGTITFWNGNPLDASGGVFDHEMGHIVGLGGGPINTTAWKAAQAKDVAAGRNFVGVVGDASGPIYGFAPAKYNGSRWMVNARAVTDYGSNSINEDWAESIRLYLLDQRTGTIGLIRKVGDVNYASARFADVYPARARLIYDWLEKPIEDAAAEAEASFAPAAEPTGAEAEAAARSLLDGAEAAEPETSRTLQEIASDTGGELAGFDFRLKTQSSLERKMRADLAEARLKDPEATLDDVAGKINDALRYTLEFKPDDYADGVNAALERLRRDGFRAVKIKNYWVADDDYKGINAVFVAPDGQRFELQFHTPESFAAKNGELHRLYEEFRVSTDRAERARLWQEMVRITTATETPRGALTIGTPERHAPPA